VRSSADYLFLKEAYGLPLAGVDLAVLSACDTERGRLVGGEGVCVVRDLCLGWSVLAKMATLRNTAVWTGGEHRPHRLAVWTGGNSRPHRLDVWTGGDNHPHRLAREASAYVI